MNTSSPSGPFRQVRVVLSATTLLRFMSAWKAAALAFAELGAATFFLIGVAGPVLGLWTPWFLLGACVLGAFVRAMDLELWVLFIPGGMTGRVRQAFGPAAGRAASAIVLAERCLLAALACEVVAHYAAGPAGAAIASWTPAGRLTAEELSTALAVSLIGLLWIRARLGRELSPTLVARGVWVGIGILLATAVWGGVTIAQRDIDLTGPLPPLGSMGWMTVAFGAALAVASVGGGDALVREAHEFPPPRVHALRRTGVLVAMLSLVTIPWLTTLFVHLVPAADAPLWASAPLAGLPGFLIGPSWVGQLASLAISIACALMLLPATRAALAESVQILRRLAAERLLPEGLAAPHRRFGTTSRAIDAAAAAAVLLMVASGGQIAWLVRAYAFVIALTVLIRILTLLRFRVVMPGPRPITAPLNLAIGRRVVPIGLLLAGVITTAALVAMLAAGDFPAVATACALAGLSLLLAIAGRRAEAAAAEEAADVFELLPSGDLSLDKAAVRPGNVLVAVRSPHSLAHVAAALQASGDRDVVIMTIRLVGAGGDVDLDHEDATTATPAERHVFSQVLALAERYGRPVRLLIVPAHDVFDGVIATLIRLQSSDIFVGESVTLSADDQARLLGEAWERAEKPENLKARLVIHHHSGRTDAYHLGAHPPALTPADFDLIHRLWLDATKTIGPHVHHHDVVRAALTHMEQQLNGPQREDGLALIREVARPADELAAAVRARDFSRLRDMTRNRHASDLAGTLTDLSLEDQVIVFRLLPRKDAASVFEYLSHEAQEALLKAMAQEDVASLLNNMAPDDRTMFLEELPAAATRQLLTLLTPAERSVALTLLGYPEHSVGRLMTPHYVAAREEWTIREVLDYIRTHGQDSETLNVIYVISDQEQLIDDIRIRELLLTPLDKHVSDLMDRHFVALKATDDQQAAVTAFRKYDRTALPVTDTAGMLIGIVTIDDVLDVAEAEATEDIQQIGGVEALDEPYMQIAFWSMIRKRAGWLTALFLGEMLTATAMGAYEDTLNRAGVLMLFLPLIISSGGNSGSQASTLVIRALALGEIGLRDWFRIMRREIFAGLALGAILGTIAILRITIWTTFKPDLYTAHWVLVALTVAVSLVGVVLWGTLSGSLLPLLLRRLGFDPAKSSAPFVATLVDVTGLVIYFSVAIVVLHGTLL